MKKLQNANEKRQSLLFLTSTTLLFDKAAFYRKQGIISIIKSDERVILG